MKVFSNFFPEKSIDIDPRITRSLFSAVESVANGAPLSLTGIGRKSGSHFRQKERYSIKRVDRLLGNETLHARRNEYYKVIIDLFLGSLCPVIHVDWSSVYDNNFFVVRASIAIDGRAITLYEEIYPAAEHTSMKAHQNFFRNLSKLLPQNCKPIICTDAGFRVTWFKLVNQYNWFWVGRVRGIMHCKLDGEKEFESVKSHYSWASAKPFELSKCTLSKTNQLHCRAILYKGPKKGRKNTNNKGVVTKDNTNKKQASAANEPWFLVSNLPTEEFPAHRIVNIYKLRMRIEETFRDNKNEYYGLGLKRSKTKQINRLNSILLIAMLAQIALYIIGKAAEQKGYHREFQANSEKSRRVLSYGFLALRILEHGIDKYPLSASELELALKELIKETYYE